MKEAEENKFATRKRKRASKDDDVDAALYTWFDHGTLPLLPQSSRKRQTTSPRYSRKILRLRMGGFAGGRPGTALNFKKAHGEKKDADFVAADTWTSTVLKRPKIG